MMGQAGAVLFQAQFPPPKLESIMLIKPSIMLSYAAALTNCASFSHQKCFSDLPKDILL